MTDLATHPYVQREAGVNLPSASERDLSPEAVYRAELPYVWHSLRRLGIRQEDLEDLTQEVFLRAFRSFADYDRARPLRPWLFSIAYRLAADHRQLARHRHEVSSDEGTDAADPAPGPEQSLETRRAQALTLQALEAVSLDRRAVFVLHELNGHSVPELAEALGLPLNTAYSRLRLARTEFADEARRLMQAKGRSGQ